MPKSSSFVPPPPKRQDSDDERDNDDWDDDNNNNNEDDDDEPAHTRIVGAFVVPANQNEPEAPAYDFFSFSKVVYLMCFWFAGANRQEHCSTTRRRMIPS